jgi:parallel beta-helix repeat protein
LVVACGVATLGTAPGPAFATHVQCGSTVTASTTLDSDLVDCPADGITIRGQGVTLDLGGHVVDGTGRGTGIVTRGQAPNDAVIRNGTVREFSDGVRVSGIRHVLENLVISDNGSIGALLNTAETTVRKWTAFENGGPGVSLNNVAATRVTDSEFYSNGSGIFGGFVLESVIEQNRIHDNEFGGIGWSSIFDSRISDNRLRDNGGSGIRFFEFSEDNLLLDNRITGSAVDGIAIDDFTGRNTIERNTTDRNGDDGIDLDYPGSTVTANKVNHNGDLGIEAVPGTIDGGGNKATGNGNQAQCTGVSCK